MGKLSGEFREPNRKDKVTRFPSVTYARQLGLLVNTLGSHLKRTRMIFQEYKPSLFFLCLKILVLSKPNSQDLKSIFSDPRFSLGRDT